MFANQYREHVCEDNRADGNIVVAATSRRIILAEADLDI